MVRPVDPGMFDRDIQGLRRLRKRLAYDGVDWQDTLIPYVDALIVALQTRGSKMPGALEDGNAQKETETTTT